MTNDNVTYEDVRISDSITIKGMKEMPLIDAHMHIQSNDIAPLPIMYGMLNFIISRTIHEYNILPPNDILTDTELKDKMNFADLSYIEDNKDELKKISRVKGIGLVINDFANDKIEISAVNALKELTVNRQIAEAVNPINVLLGVGLELGQLILNNNPDIQREILTNVVGFFFPYGKVTRHNSFFVAGMYKDEIFWDSTLGYASRIQSDGKNKPIDMIKGKNERYILVAERKDEGRGFFSIVSRHYYGNRYFNIGFKIRMSVVHGMELMYAHYWGAYGIPLYIPGEDGSMYYITNNIKNKNEEVYCAYDIPKETVDKIVDRTASDVGNTAHIDNDLLGKKEKYSHFLKKAPASELDQYEDLIKHVEYTEVVAVNYPLEYLPFYHLDPRRFFAPVEKISEYHDFYCCDTNQIKKMPDGWIETRLKNGNWQYKMDFKEDVKPRLLCNGGMFWGIKLYAALGYPPYLGANGNSEAKKAFRCLEENDYQELLDFYDECAKNEIPITCHGSPQGMTIADPGIYLKEFLKDNTESDYGSVNNVNFPMDGKTFMNGIGLIDSFSSPRSWEIVLDALDKKGMQKPKLCLAHFGGHRYFNGTFEAKNKEDKDTPYRWLDKIAELINKHDVVYTDLSCFVFKYFVPFPKVISFKVYNDVKDKADRAILQKVYGSVPNRSGTEYACDNAFVNGKDLDEETLKKIARLRIELVIMAGEMEHKDKHKYELNCYRELNETANNLAGIIEKNKKLRHRIMFGTDWPMTELDVKGVSRYNSAMFVLLQVVTDKLGNEWDAWHQFAVVNPLRFLGLLEDPDNELDEYKINFEKIDKMKAAIEKYINDNLNGNDDDNFNKKYGMTGDKCKNKLNSAYVDLKRMYGNALILAAHKMKHGDKLLLTAL
jgi:hypothetical protein